MAVSYLVRKTGNDNNGGTSQSVRSTGTDGVTNGTNTLTSASASWTSADIGHGIFIGGVNQWRTITAVGSGTSLTFSGATIGAGSGRTWTVGGSWLTVNQALVTAATAVAAGDSIYIGAGTYRETTAVAKSGTSALLPISVIGDVDGAVTGDPGEVQITNYLVNDKTAGVGVLLALGTQTYLTFDHVVFISGGSAVVTNSSGSRGMTFTDCTFIQAAGAAALSFASSVTGLPMDYLFDRCSVVQMTNSNCFAVTLTTTASGSGDWDANFTIRNCFIWALGSACGVTNSGTNPNKGGGVRMIGCTVVGASSAMSTAGNSGRIPCEARYNLVIGTTVGFSCSVANLNNLIEDHNLIIANTVRSNVPIGPGSVSFPSYAPLFDAGQAFKVSGIARPFLSPSSPTSPLLAFGQFMQNTGGPPSAFLASSMFPPGTPGWRPPALRPFAIQSPLGAQVPAPTYDWANRPRPAGTGSNLPTVGYLEYHDSATKDTSTFDVTPASAKLVGPGDIDLLVPVDAGSQTISIRCLYDTAYNGQQFPTLSLLANGEIGVTAQSVAAAGGAWGTWQTITLAAINPTASGIVKVRFTSRDGGGTSQVNVDTFSVV